jgi:hypothetical protein
MVKQVYEGHIAHYRGLYHRYTEEQLELLRRLGTLAAPKSGRSRLPVPSKPHGSPGRLA